MTKSTRSKKVDELTTTVAELETLDEPYRPVSQLHVPEVARKRLNAEGYDVQWIRVIVPNSNGALDSQNIIKKESDQYEFIPRSEIDGLSKAMTSYFGDEIDKSSHGLYIVGDLALAKVKFSHLERKRKYVDQRTQDKSKSIVDDLRRNKVLPASEREEGWKIETTQPNGGRNTEFG